MKKPRLERNYASTQLPSTVEDLTGREFGFWTVLSYAGSEMKPGETKGHHYWTCSCRCGTVADISGSSIRTHTRSCGCRNRVPREEGGLAHHNLCGHPDYQVWKGMIARCMKPKNKDYPNWGGRGIKVCERWADSPQSFFDDMGPRPTKKHSIDREDNAGNYEPGNCRWATPTEQARNRRSNRVIEHDGRSMKLVEWAAEYGLRVDTLHHRLALGWDFEKAISEPGFDERGIRNTSRKLNEDVVSEIRRLHAQGQSLRSLATRYKVSYPTIRNIVLSLTWAHVENPGVCSVDPGGDCGPNIQARIARAIEVRTSDDLPVFESEESIRDARIQGFMDGLRLAARIAREYSDEANL